MHTDGQMVRRMSVHAIVNATVTVMFKIITRRHKDINEYFFFKVNVKTVHSNETIVHIMQNDNIRAYKHYQENKVI